MPKDEDWYGEEDRRDIFEDPSEGKETDFNKEIRENEISSLNKNKRKIGITIAIIVGILAILAGMG